MRSPRRRCFAVAAFLTACVSGIVAAVVGVTGAGAAAAIPIGQSMTGTMTYYNDAGYGACGSSINAATEDLVAVSYTWWTTANPNNDPLCQGTSVTVTYAGKSITVPVKDKCPSCDSTHIDLSQSAFAQLAAPDLGVVNGITWKFVSSTSTTPTATASTTTASSSPTGSAPSAAPTTSTSAAPTTSASNAGSFTPTVPTASPTASSSGQYPAWQSNHFYPVGALVSYDGHTYRCIQAHTTLTGWEPPIVPALWQVLS